MATLGKRQLSNKSKRKNLWGNKQKTSGAVSRTKPSRAVNLSRFFPFFWLFVGLVVVGGSYKVGALLLSQPVTRVVVNGEFRNVVKASIAEEVVPYLDDGFVMLDLDGIRQQLLSRPWVFEVNVTRRWPDQIVIAVTEQTPIAHWGEEGFLNHRGDFFRSENPASVKLDKDLPLLHGPKNSTVKVMGHFGEWRNMLQRKKLNIYELSLAEDGGWSAVIGNERAEHKIPIILGSGDVMEKMRRFISAYDSVLFDDFSRVDRIDMRYSNGLAVAWRKKITNLKKDHS